MNYVFYDTETTGTRRWFDQILQFAGVLVGAEEDQEFVERESLVLRCRRMVHILPSAGALLATGLKPSDLEEAPLSHYSMIREIHTRLQAWSPAVFVGFNSIEFDEEFLRQAFYQSLLYAFVTNSSGNQRADLLKIIHALYVLQPSALKVPLREDGKPIFKLPVLCRANDLEQTSPHEALSDVRATMALAQVVRQRAPQIWQRGVQLGRKDFVGQVLRRHAAVLWVGCQFNEPFSRWVTHLGQHPKRPNELLCFDLACDPSTFVWDEKSKGVWRIKTNEQPFLVEPEWLSLFPSHEVSAEMMERVSWIRAHPEFVRQVIEAISLSAKEYEKSEHIEEQIYEGFASHEDGERMLNFHEAPWEERVTICQKFSDKRFEKLGLRLIFNEQPQLLTAAERQRFSEKIAKRLNRTDKPPWRTFARAFEGIELERQKPDLSPEVRQHLQEIFDYLEKLRRDHSL